MRVGEASGSLVQILEAISIERQRAEALRRRLSETLRYPAFLLSAACGVLLFFLLVVLPQFTNVFKDFNAKLDPVLLTFLGLSDFLRKDMNTILLVLVGLLSIGFLLSRRPRVRARVIGAVVAPSAREPGVGISPDGAFLPQPRPAAGERRDFANEPARSRRYDGDVERRLDLDRSR